MDTENRYASNGKGNLAVTLGAVGLGASLLDGCAKKVLGGVLGDGCGNSAERGISHYEAGLNARIAELETEVKLRDANTFTMGEMGKLRDYVDGRFASVEHELCDQKVYNATLNGAVGCIQGQIAQLAALTKTIIPIANICPTPAVATPTTGA